MEPKKQTQKLAALNVQPQSPVWHGGRGFDSPGSDCHSPLIRAGHNSASPSPARGSPTHATGRSRSPFARAANRRRAKIGTASPPDGSPHTSPLRSRPRQGNAVRRRSSVGNKNKSFTQELDKDMNDIGEFLDQNFLEILYGIGVAMVLVVLVTSLIARAYIPPYKGWDSERRIYNTAMWYSGGMLIFLILAPILGPMLYNACMELEKFSAGPISRQKAALRAFRKGWKTGIIFYDRIGDRARSAAGLPPMEQPLRSRLCV